MDEEDVTKLLSVIAVLLILLTCAAVYFNPPRGLSGLRTEELPPELQTKADACHKKNMGAGRWFESGKLVDIKCYER